ncbi:MAG TPA: hypothetical protein VF525_15160 [Pyrinomonadaceae bacterium]|jgi:hypothetical protein
MKNFVTTLLFTLAVGAATAGAQTPTTAKQPAPAAPQTKSAPAQPVAAVDCGCEAQPLPTVLAVVNGVKLNAQDLSAETQRAVAQLQQQVVAARTHELDLKINSLLLEAEAKQRGISTTKLLQDEVVAKTTEPTEADAQAFYDQNKQRIKGEFKDVKTDIVAFLREERQGELAGKLAEKLRAAAQVKILTQTVTPPANTADRARVFANVNGRDITSADIEASLQPLILEVQQRVYDLRKREIDVQINDMLLQQAAQKRGLTPRALLDTEINAKLPPVSDAQAQKFYDENKERISGEFAQVKPQLVEYLKNLDEQKAMVAYAEQLRRAASVQVFLTAPTPEQKAAAKGN